MKRYFKIRVGKRRVFVRVTSNPNSPVMTGTRITSEGDEFETENATGVSREVIAFGESDIISEYEMSVHYARLVPKSRYA
jgi:hypothetical protein